MLFLESRLAKIEGGVECVSRVGAVDVYTLHAGGCSECDGHLRFLPLHLELLLSERNNDSKLKLAADPR